MKKHPPFLWGKQRSIVDGARPALVRIEKPTAFILKALLFLRIFPPIFLALSMKLLE
jgi:hypothetical protein